MSADTSTGCTAHRPPRRPARAVRDGAVGQAAFLDPEAPAWIRQVNGAFAKLNAVVFGPQEYAVVAMAAGDQL
jgi:hypothetical protein